jgi:hypothetical protein
MIGASAVATWGRGEDGEGSPRHIIATPTTMRIIHTSLFVLVYPAFLDLAMPISGPIAGFIVRKFGQSAISLCGSAAAGCAFMLTLFLYPLVRAPHAHLQQRTLEPLETGENKVGLVIDRWSRNRPDRQRPYVDASVSNGGHHSPRWQQNNDGPLPS